jgi:hypothetical protein
MTIFKNLTLLAFLFLAFTACNNDDDPEIIDSSVPTGQFTVAKSGTFVAENGTPTAGTVEIGTDEDGENFLHFGTNFTTELGTGTVSIYLSTSQTFTPDPANGNPNLRVVGSVGSNGEQYIKLASAVDSKFTHIILWCGTANIPFGYAALN